MEWLFTIHIGNASAIEMIWTGVTLFVTIYIGRRAVASCHDVMKAIALETEDAELLRIIAIEYAVVFCGLWLLVVPDLLVGVSAMTVPPRPDVDTTGPQTTMQTMLLVGRQVFFAMLAYVFNVIRSYKVQVSLRAAERMAQALANRGDR